MPETVSGPLLFVFDPLRLRWWIPTFEPEGSNPAACEWARQGCLLPMRGIGCRSGMDADPTPRWQPISALPMLAALVEDMLGGAREHYETLGQARARPSMLDDATLDRVVQVYGKTAEDHWLFEEQAARWAKETLTPQQRREVERFGVQVDTLGEVLAAILALAEELRAGAMDRILEKSDLELGLEYLLRLRVARPESCGGGEPVARMLPVPPLPRTADPPV